MVVAGPPRKRVSMVCPRSKLGPGNTSFAYCKLLGVKPIDSLHAREDDVHTKSEAVTLLGVNARRMTFARRLMSLQ